MMKHSVSGTDTESVQQDGSDLLQQMLERRAAPEPATIDGIAVGELVGLTADGEPLVRVEALGLDARVARCAAVVDLSLMGQALALAFEGGDPKKPIILGVMRPQPRSVEITPPRSLDASVDGRRRVVIQAEQEIELRCGEAAIILTADGRILLRGQNITSEAEMSQRILGASVSVN